MQTRKEFIGGFSASLVGLASGCRTWSTASGFSMTVLNPDSMVGGAGQCVVMRTPKGKTYLYDTGNGDFWGKKAKNNGRDIVAPWLTAHGISKIDGLIISHYHADHFGGLLWLWDHFPIARIFNNNNTPDLGGLSECDLMEYKVPRKCLDDWGRAHPGCLVENTKAGDDLGWNEDGVRFDVVWPPKEGYVKPLENRAGYLPGDNPFHHLLNANSTALRIVADGRTFFIAGDIQPDYVRQCMRPKMEREGTWGCDLLVLPAHGTMSENLLADVNAMKPRPRTVIASLGNLPWMIDCGKDVRRIYGAAGYETYATCLDGDVSFTEDVSVRTDASKIYRHQSI